VSIKAPLWVIFIGLLCGATDSITALILSIQRNIEAGKTAAARQQVEAGLKSYPENAGLYNLLGVIEAQDGNYGPAEHAFRKTLEHASQFTGAWLNLGRLYQGNAQTDPQAAEKALNAYRSILAYEPGNAEANYRAATLLTGQRSFAASLEHLARLSGDSQNDPPVLALRCADLAGLGERDKAEAAARLLIDHPQLYEDDVIAVLPALDSANSRDLREFLLAGLQRRRLLSPNGWRAAAGAYEGDGKFAEARAALERSAQGPLTVASLLDLARIAYKQRDLQGALGYLAHARDLDPNNAAVHFFFGMVTVELDLPLEARKSLEQAVRLNPDNPWYNYALGAVAVQGRSPEDAVPYFRKYSQFRPNDPRGQFGAGVAYFYAKNFDAAATELKPIADRPETQAGVHYLLGRIAMAQDDLPAAQSELRKAVAGGGSADAWAELGLVYLRQRDYEEARRALDRALALDPEGYLPNLNVLILYQRTKDPRADAQSQRFEKIKTQRSENEKLLMRMIEVRPY
jgi:tetratricopeptide (TPR) repeat protein